MMFVLRVTGIPMSIRRGRTPTGSCNGQVRHEPPEGVVKRLGLLWRLVRVRQQQAVLLDGLVATNKRLAHQNRVLAGKLQQAHRDADLLALLARDRVTALEFLRSAHDIDRLGEEAS